MALQGTTGNGARPEMGRLGRLTGGRPIAGLGRLSGSTAATFTGCTTICKQIRHLCEPSFPFLADLIHVAQVLRDDCSQYALVLVLRARPQATR